ncbi:hypothetical protein KI387_005692, partial [Taxus chinensis]
TIRFQVMPPMAFYPVNWTRIHSDFQRPNDGRVRVKWIKAKLLQMEVFGMLIEFYAAGEYVLMSAQDPEKPPYVARIEKIKGDGDSNKKKNVKVQVWWYYQLEESIGGQRQFHGVKELFLSDHYDVQSVDTIEGKCT